MKSLHILLLSCTLCTFSYAASPEETSALDASVVLHVSDSLAKNPTLSSNDKEALIITALARYAHDTYGKDKVRSITFKDTIIKEMHALYNKIVALFTPQDPSATEDVIDCALDTIETEIKEDICDGIDVATDKLKEEIHTLVG